MLRTMSRKLVPLPFELAGSFNKNIIRAFKKKNQRVSYSASKVLYAGKKQATLQTQEDLTDASNAQSIIAKSIYDNRISDKNYENDIHLPQSTEDLRTKLQDLSGQIRSSLSVDSSEIPQVQTEQRQPDSTDLYSHKSIEVEDQSVEQLVFKDDILSQPKPSPLLGTEDPIVPGSKIPCVGCGALLQCHNRIIPGFLPSERFKLMTEADLKRSICQRCHYIQHHDTFFATSASPDSYASMISRIKNTRSVVLMVVDVMDITGSIVPNLMDSIGHMHPIIVVGNKADLLAPDCTDYLAHTREALRKACYDAGYSNIRKVTFVSAKTGFGLERLISFLFSYYNHRVDVFIVGTANAGKSSLFNTLLASDYCKHTARDLIQRATVSVWPGTTLNLLKFPIMRPSSRTVTLRHKRLRQEKAIKEEMKKSKQGQNKEKELIWELKGDVNKTDVRTENQRENEEKSAPWGQEIVGYVGGRSGSIRLPTSMPKPSSFEEENYTNSYWMYDTPGVINPDQTMNMLEPHESSFLSPVTMIIPRCILLKPGTTVFASGLSRLDYVEGEEYLIATFHCSSSIPLKVVMTEEADSFYLENVGTAELGIPLGDKSRLDKIPSLIGKEFNLIGENNALAVADIQLSSIGWVSIAPKAKCHAKLYAFTPGGRGISLRTPPLAPKYTQFRGKRISSTPFFRIRPQGFAMIGRTLSR